MLAFATSSILVQVQYALCCGSAPCLSLHMQVRVAHEGESRLSQELAGWATTHGPCYTESFYNLCEGANILNPALEKGPKKYVVYVKKDTPLPPKKKYIFLYNCLAH